MKKYIVAISVLCLAACSGPNWRETNVLRTNRGSVPRDQSGNPILYDASGNAIAPAATGRDAN